MSECCFGIHVGNSTACLAVYRDGRIDVVANDAGDRVTPAHVTFNNEGKEVVVGLAAKHGRFRNAKATVTKNKTLLSGLYDPSEPNRYAKVIHENKTYKYNIDCDEKIMKVTTEDIHKHILRYIRDIADSQTDIEEKDAVLTVPLNFTEEQRKIVEFCGKKSGFNIVQVINEPAAAILAYEIGQNDPNVVEYCLVYRIGGVSMSCTVCRVQSGMISVLGNVEKQIGGDKLTGLITSYLSEEFQRKYKIDPKETKRGYFKLENSAESIKHILSSLDTANCYIESLVDGIDFNLNVTKARFENELGKILTDFVSPIHQALGKANLKPEEITKVILCGGTCKIPKIQSSVSGMFKEAEILCSLNPDEVIATGAAYQASQTSNFKEMTATVQATSMAILSEFEVLIPIHTPIPVRRSHHITLKDDQTSISVKIFIQNSEGKSELTMLKLEDLPLDRKVSVSAHIYRDGGLHLALTDKKSGKCDEITFSPSANKTVVNS